MTVRSWTTTTHHVTCDFCTRAITDPTWVRLARMSTHWSFHAIEEGRHFCDGHDFDTYDAHHECWKSAFATEITEERQLELARLSAQAWCVSKSANGNPCFLIEGHSGRHAYLGEP